MYTKIASIKEIRWIRHFYLGALYFSTQMNFSINFSSAGFVETSLEHIKHVHVQLNMNSLQLEKGPSWKRKVGEHASCLTFSRTLFSGNLLKRLGLCIYSFDAESLFVPKPLN